MRSIMVPKHESLVIYTGFFLKMFLISLLATLSLSVLYMALKQIRNKQKQWPQLSKVRAK